MTQRFVRSLLLASSLSVFACGAQAADWQREFFSPMTNELPATRGVAVDDLGYVHVQAFNRQPWSTDYDFAHLYTFDAQGQTPWMWGLAMANRKSDCGVYAKSGQRLDCLVYAGWSGDETRLQMQAAGGSQTLWQTFLPAEVELLDAGIAEQNVALFVGHIVGPAGVELGVFRASGYGPADVLSVMSVCPMSGQAPAISRFRMPDAPGESIRHIKACPTGFGATELIAEQFDAISGQWTTLSQRSLPFGAQVTRAEINADGKGFVLVDHGNGMREVLASGIFGNMWFQMPIPGDGEIAAFFANEDALVIAVEGAAQDRIDVESVIRFDIQNGFWPQFTPTPMLATQDAEAFALSGQGALLVAGKSPTLPQTSHHLWQIDRFGMFQPVAPLTLAANETTNEPPTLRIGPNNVVVVARTIVREEFFGEPQIGLRVNQFDLPM
ncbi:MAG: hypothetical protein ACOY82_13115 [Pseudomonadota bacterium]